MQLGPIEVSFEKTLKTVEDLDDILLPTRELASGLKLMALPG